MIRVTSVAYTNEFTAATTDYLLGNVGDKITCDITCELDSAIPATTEDYYDITFIAATDTIRLGLLLPSFTSMGYFTGMTVSIADSTSNDGEFTVLSVSDREIVVSGSLTDETSTAAILSDSTTYAYAGYRASLIPNSESATFASLVDGNDMYWKGGADYTSESFAALTKQGRYLSNSLDTVEIKGIGSGGSGAVANTFIIRHVFYITPLTVEEPIYFSEQECLKHVYQVELMASLSNPNYKHTTTDLTYRLGNTGWFDENFNGGPTSYSMSEPEFSFSAAVVDQPNYDEDTGFTIVVTNADSPFSNNNTEFVVSHFIVPEAESDYIDTTTTFTQNHMFDRVFNTVGSAAAHGINNGGDNQVLQSVSATYNSATQITITGKINFSSAYKARLMDMTDKNFVLTVAVQNHSLATEVADRVTLKTDVLSYTEDLDNSGVGGGDIEFFQHWDINETDALDFAGVFLYDNVVSKAQFYVDHQYDIDLKRASVILKAVHDDGEEFELERQDFSFDGAPEIDGVKQIYVDTTRGYRMLSDNPLNQVTLQRKSSLDTAEKAYYELYYPFQIRWENFFPLPNVAESFYDPEESQLGLNNDWSRYDGTSGWQLTYVLELEIDEVLSEDTTHTNIIQVEKNLHAYGADSATWFNNAEIAVYGQYPDPEDGAITETETDAIDTTVTSKIVATFTYNGGGSPPTVDEVEGVIYLARKDQDGTSGIIQISSVHVCPKNQALYNTGDLLTVAEDTTYSLTCFVDPSKLDQSASYQIHARLYQTNVTPTDFLS